jgi:lysyl-tRNA synthetase class 2
MYLRIATEVALKKAIVGGMERVFEIGRIFRNEAVDRTHYPEFTSIELYAAYSDLRGMKILFRDMLNHIGFPSWMYTPGADLPEMEYSDAVATYGQDFETKMPAKMTLVTGQPLEETPLCKAREDDPTKADRFEAFCNGFEVANAYNELNDPDEQAKRLAGANDDGLVEAMRYGMPPCGGMGIGIDRLVMLATGAESIRDVIMFPTSRE